MTGRVQMLLAYPTGVSMRSLLALLALSFPTGLAAQQPDSLPAGLTPAMVQRGKLFYEGPGLCASCHGLEGRGIPNAGVDLTDAVWAAGDGRLRLDHEPPAEFIALSGRHHPGGHQRRGYVSNTASTRCISSGERTAGSPTCSAVTYCEARDSTSIARSNA